MKNKRKGGFSLIETVIAMALLTAVGAVCLTISLGTRNQMVRIHRMERLGDQAVAMVQENAGEPTSQELQLRFRMGTEEMEEVLTEYEIRTEEAGGTWTVRYYRP